MASPIKRQKLFDFTAIESAYEADWCEDTSTIENRRRLVEIAKRTLIKESDFIRRNFIEKNASGRKFS